MTRNKFKAIRTEIDGITFDSKAEARRYAALQILQRAGEIHSLKCQVPYPLKVNGEPIGKYICDFEYVDLRSGKTVVEDVKSPATANLPLFKWKRKHVKAQYGVDVLVTS